MRQVLTSWRVILLLIFIACAFVALHPAPWTDGAAIRAVTPNSSAAVAGIAQPSQKLQPIDLERILTIDGVPVHTADDFLSAGLTPNSTVTLKTTKNTYRVTVPEDGDIGVTVIDAPKNNLRLGLDLRGGTRVVLAPESPVDAETFSLAAESLRQRLNVFGISDVTVREATDLAGGQFIVVEIADITQQEVRDLLENQGKFEAYIGDVPVFVGGREDITYVCRSSACSGIDPRQGCGPVQGGFRCAYAFEIALSPQAAKRMADTTAKLGIIALDNQLYLNESLRLMLDDSLVTSLQIDAGLRGKPSTSVQMSGSGFALTQQEAVTAALADMKKLQTVIITGSLPVKMSIERIDTLSAVLGAQFLSNAILIGLCALCGVAIVVYARYRRLGITGLMMLAVLCEVVLLLGFAALVRWNLDIAALAGIIIAIGTGVDHFIIITDETLRKEHAQLSWTRKIKEAMAIVFGAYLTSLGAMFPLWFAGAGLLSGFAFTTIAGLTFGVMIVRPAYAHAIKILLGKGEE